MPTYEYACTECQNQWEEVQKISEDPIQTCPKCGKSSAKRQISGSNFILKGGGWYADLYSSTKKPDAKSNGSNGASTSGSPEKKAESAAPAKAEPSSSGSSGSAAS